MYVTGQNKIQIKIFLSQVDSQFLLSPIIHESGLGDKEN